MSGPYRVAIEIAIALAVTWAALTVANPALTSASGPAIEEAGAPSFPKRSYTLRVPDLAASGSPEVTVSENGHPVRGLRIEAAADGRSNSFATVLLIDASNSMAGTPIVEAMRAARTFADHQPPRQELAVLSFNREIDVMVPFDADEEEIDAALSPTPPLASSTRVYDATAVALTMLADLDVGAGTIVVLSDGTDNGSETTLADVMARARAAGVRIFTVGLRSDVFDPEALEELAVGGAFAETAEPEALAPLLEDLGAELAAEYLLSYRSDADQGDAVRVEVQIEGVAGTARDRYDVPLEEAAAVSPRPGGRGFWDGSIAMFMAAALAAGLFGLAVFVLAGARQETARERVGRFLHPQLVPGAQAGDDGRASAALSLLNPIERVMAGRGWWARFNEELEVAGVKVPAIRVLVATFLGTILAALLFTRVIGVPVLVPLALLVPFGVRYWIKRKLRERREAFAEQLADNLQVVASAIRAGQSMVGAFAVVVEEAAEPSSSEFRRMVNDERLGVPLEEAIRSIGRRMDNRDMEQLALVAIIQRETGGNTAEVLDQLISTIRERAALRRLVKTLTAQGRLTQAIVSVLPLVLLLAVTVIQPEYMKPLFETGGGHIALAVGAVLSIMGSLIIKRIVEVRV